MRPCGTGDGATAQEYLDCSDTVHEVLCYITSALFSMLHRLLDSGQLYTLQDEELHDWIEVKKRPMKTVKLLLVF